MDTEFRRVRADELPAYREQFADAADARGTRYEVDRFVAASLKLPSISKTEYELLAAEPMLTRKRL